MMAAQGGRMENPPDQLKTAAIVQLVGGLIDLVVGAWIASFIWTCISGVCTLGMCPIGGLLGLLVVPLAILEIISGIVGLTNPKSAGMIMKITSFLSMGGILLGSISSLVAGVIVFMQLSNPEVKAYLEGP
jgi:hypothetical protein